MFFFNKNDSRTIEQLIFDIAQHQRNKDIRLLKSRMRGKQVFAPIPEEIAGNVENGNEITADGSAKYQWPVVNIQGKTFVQCLSNRNNKICSNGAISMSFEDAQNMVKVGNFDGIYIHNGLNSWCCLM